MLSSAGSPRVFGKGRDQAISAMTYKEYAARVTYDPTDRIFAGRLAGINDIVTFHGATVDELETAFRDAVDHTIWKHLSELAGNPRSHTPAILCCASLKMHMLRWR